MLLIAACWHTERVNYYDAGLPRCVGGAPPRSWWSSVHALSVFVDAGQDAHRAGRAGSDARVASTACEFLSNPGRGRRVRLQAGRRQRYGSQAFKMWSARNLNVLTLRILTLA